MNKTWPLLYINFAINMFHLYVCTLYSWCVMCLLNLSAIFVVVPLVATTLACLHVPHTFHVCCRLTIAYILISQLLYGDISKQIKTRLSRLWDFHDINDEEKIYHTELVLLDETVIIDRTTILPLPRLPHTLHSFSSAYFK